MPIIFKSDASKAKIDLISNTLNYSCNGKCLLIASVDFSHYQPGALAEIHDNLSIRALNNLDKELINKVEVDSPESLSMAMYWAQLNNSNQFQLENNTNSGKLADSRDAESTSYVFGWYQKGDPSTTLRSAQDDVEYGFTFTIGGDMMFDRLIDYRFSGNDLYKSLENLGERFFWGTDLSIVNIL